MYKENVIELSKVKLTLIILISVVFIIISVYLLFLDSQTIESHRRFSSPTFVDGISVMSIVFFGLCAFTGIRKLFYIPQD